MKGLFIPDITAEMFRNGSLEGIEALMSEGEIYDIDYDPEPFEGKERVMGIKKYKLPNGKIAAFEYDESGVGKVTLECMDELMAMVADRPQGKWIEKEVIYKPEASKVIEEWQSAKCDQCGIYHTTPYMYFFHDYNFCPICGADMRGEQE